MPTSAVVKVTLYSSRSFQDEALGAAALSLIDRAHPSLVPNKYGHSEPLKRLYKPGEHTGPLAVWMGEGNVATSTMGELLLQGQAPAEVGYFFSWDLKPRFNMASIYVAAGYGETAEGLTALTSLADELVRTCDPVFGMVRYLPPLTTNTWILTDLRIRLPEPGWILYMGQPYVDLFGEEQLLRAPCQEVQKMPSGQIKLRLAETPFAVEVGARQRLREYLGTDAFVEEGMSIKRYKSGRAPVFDFAGKMGPQP